MSSSGGFGWFKALAGCSEAEFRRLEASPFEEDPSTGELLLRGRWRAGAWSVESLGALQEGAPADRKQQEGPCEFEILTRAASASAASVDVAAMQADPQYKEAVFQVASNFTGVEAVSEFVPPDAPGFLEQYPADRTQGPRASISAGAGAIARVYAAFRAAERPWSEWRQTAAHQVNFLEALRDELPVANGYVLLTARVPPFPRRGTAAYEERLARACVGYHRNQQVTSGGGDRAPAADQVVDQVLCAALNIGQGRSGRLNAELDAKDDFARTRFCLDVAYRGTYLAAVKHGRRHIVLTLIGGGVFGNSMETIFDAIVDAHTAYSGALDNVSCVFFSPHDLRENVPRLEAKLKTKKVPVRVVVAK